jgi:hypothetical protein
MSCGSIVNFCGGKVGFVRMELGQTHSKRHRYEPKLGVNQSSKRRGLGLLMLMFKTKFGGLLMEQ